MATPPFVPSPAADAAKQFSPVDDEPPLRWQRAVHLAPDHGLGVFRRAIFFALLTWLPIAIWALVRGRFLNAVVGEPLLQHYGVHVRCLVTIPMFILGEATLHKAGLRYFPQFITSGIVDEVARPRFEAAVRTLHRWRDSSIPWFVVIGIALAWPLIDRTPNHVDEMSWALDEKGTLGFGGVWFAYVVRPVFLGLLLGWIWRIALLAMVLLRLSRLGLSLVPSHPDRAGGLGFLEKLPSAFDPVSFGLASMLASRWAHQIVHHGLTLNALKVPAAVFVVVWSLLLLVPLAALMPLLHAAKRAALPSYAAVDRRPDKNRCATARARGRGGDRRRRNDVWAGEGDADPSDRQGVARRDSAADRRADARRRGDPGADRQAVARSRQGGDVTMTMVKRGN
jgi:hypothetical protein